MNCKILAALHLLATALAVTAGEPNVSGNVLTIPNVTSNQSWRLKLALEDDVQPTGGDEHVTTGDLDELSAEELKASAGVVAAEGVSAALMAKSSSADITLPTGISTYPIYPDADKTGSGDGYRRYAEMHWRLPLGDFNGTVLIYCTADMSKGSIDMISPYLAAGYAVLSLDMRTRAMPSKNSAFSGGSPFTPRQEDVTLENVRLINTNSMGILPLHTKDLYIRGLRMMRDEASKGLLTNSADAIHAITNSGNFVVEDSILEDMMDDAMNVHGQFQLVETCVGNKLTVRITARSITQYCNLCDVGDEIAVYRENTMVPRTVCHVTACRILDTYRAELTLDTEPVGVCTDDMVQNLSGNCALTLRRCRFAKANTHLRFQTRGKVLVEDCVTELPFWLTGDATFWYESSPCTDFTVKNTYFIKKAAIIKSCPQVRVCPEAPYYHKNATVTDCVFTNDTPLSLCYTDNVRFLNNRHVLGDAMQIHAQNCGVIEAPGCTIERETSEQVLGNN